MSLQGDALVGTQLLMAQAIFAIAEHIGATTGFGFTAVPFAKLPSSPARGMVACISDSTVNTWAGVVAGGGTNAVMAWYDGTNWKVMGA